MNKGYGHCGGAMTGQRHIAAHRLSWILHKGPIPDALCVLHHCDTKSCTNPDHLFLGTHADNVADKVKKGRQAKGESAPKAKLTSSDIPKVFEMRSRGMTQWAIANVFGVHQGSIWRILTGKSWAWLSKNLIASHSRT